MFFTNGSIVQNSTEGDTDTPVTLDRNTKDRGLFTLWEKLAARDPKFGNPAKFISDIDKTNFYTYVVTISGDRTFHDYMEAKTGSKSGTGGQILIVDSSWGITVTLFDKYFPDQPDDVYVAGGNAFHTNVPGDYVKKTTQESTGAELWAETLYHCGLKKDQIDSIVDHSKVRTNALPYITSQFMPRKISDRPKVIPDGCVNLAFLGQYVEHGECVFTVEGSVRSAMLAVWGLTGLDKPIIPLPEPIYDIRVLADNAKMSTGGKELTAETLGAMAGDGGKTSAVLTQIVSLLNKITEPSTAD